MCLAIPAKVTSVVPGGMSEIDILGVTRHASLDLVPEAVIGDYVLVHAGFAIQVVDEEYARETIAMLKAIELVDDNYAFGEPFVADGETRTGTEG